MTNNKQQTPHGFCETPEQKCTMNYCDENGCQNRKRTLTEPTEMPNNKQQTVVQQFVATFKTSIQIGPDDWKVINPSMLCNQNTTLGEIEHFVNSNNNVGILEFKVIELTYGGGNNDKQ
jgi:hypothetical protein